MRLIRNRVFVAICLVWGNMLPAWAQTAAPPLPTQPARQPQSPLLLARALPVPLRQYTLKELAARWPAFQHAPFESAGHNHVSLPFRWSSEGGLGDPAEGAAFAFLLGNDLDWSPGNYCARHAYFVFKRGRRYMKKMLEGYDPAAITFAVKDWEATHAVGGLLKRTPLGYTGALEIFDSTGKQIHTKQFPGPREYFELLGQMGCEALRYFGHKPNEAMIKHLHRKRCKDPQSLVDLGKAAFVKERTDEEFGLYRRILQRDPEFADVRYWYSNQKWWTDRDTAEYYRQKGMACRSYLVLSALTDFQPSRCPDKDLAAMYEKWLGQADRLTDGRHAQLLQNRLHLAIRSGSVRRGLIDRGTQTARRYPNSHWLLYYLAKGWHETCLDADQAAGIASAAVMNRYLVGRGGKYDTTRQWAWYVYNLGYYDQAAALLRRLMVTEKRRNDLPKAASSALLLGDTLRQMGRHSEAVQVYRLAFHYHRPEEPERGDILVKAAVCAAQAGRKKVLKQILADRRKEIEPTGMLALVEAYDRLLDGHTVSAQGIAGKGRHGWDNYKEELELSCQLDLLAGKQAQRGTLARFMARDPNWRSHWVLYDAYDRAKPQGKSMMFYEALEWLYPDDPWVARSAQAARLRILKPLRIEPDDLLHRLKDYAPDEWATPADRRDDRARGVFAALPYGAVESAARRLLGEGKHDQAIELTRRFRRLAAAFQAYQAMRRANRVLHLVQQAKGAGASGRPVQRSEGMK